MLAADTRFLTRRRRRKKKDFPLGKKLSSNSSVYMHGTSQASLGFKVSFCLKCLHEDSWVESVCVVLEKPAPRHILQPATLGRIQWRKEPIIAVRVCKLVACHHVACWHQAVRKSPLRHSRQKPTQQHATSSDAGPGPSSASHKWGMHLARWATLCAHSQAAGCFFFSFFFRFIDTAGRYFCRCCICINVSSQTRILFTRNRPTSHRKVFGLDPVRCLLSGTKKPPWQVKGGKKVGWVPPQL